MKYLSLFSGIGGIELGIQQAYEERNKSLGWSKQTIPKTTGSSQGTKNKRELFKEWEYDCIGFSEIDKYAIQIYEKHFNHKNYGDITRINIQELPDFDLIVGGFPCQSFSIAGKRGGFKDTRGTLFFNIAEIARIKRPRLLCLENVKGLLSHDKGNTFATIISTLDELGYDCQWSVLNSKNFGVPQNRERVFIIGHLRGEPRPKVFPITGNPEKDNELQRGVQKIQVASTLRQRDYKDGYQNLIEITENQSQGYRVYDPKGISSTLAGEAGGVGAKTGLYCVASRGRNPENPSDRTTGSPTEQRLEINKQGTTNTLTNIQKDNWLTDGKQIRRLTPTECERLQGFPDGWTEGVSDTQRYKCLGNAVTVNVIKEIFKRL